MKKENLMSTIRCINISLELFGVFLSLILILSLLLYRIEKDALNSCFLKVLILNTLLLGSDAAAWGLRSRPGTAAWYGVHTANFLVYVLGYFLLAAFTDYLMNYIAAKGPVSRKPVILMRGLALTAVLLVIISQFNHMYYLIDENNVYHRQGLFWLSQMWGIFCIVLNAGLLFHHRKKLSDKDILVFTVYIALPLLAMLIQIFVYGIALLYLSTTITILCIYLGIQEEEANKRREKERELTQGRIAVMLSQIQPHFLYNSLLGIKQLCDTEPRKASDALVHFSYFLRGNLDSLTDIRLIPFSKEINHVQDYLYLEKMRFEERLNIEWDITFDDFFLPPLTLQPLVENAVRYGITEQEEGGTIWIQSKLTSDAVIITIIDDGCGFDTAETKADGHTHIGITNVRQRLESQCHASLAIISIPGVGTKAEITIPLKEGIL